MRGKRGFQLALVSILLLVGGCNSGLQFTPTVDGTVPSSSGIPRTAVSGTTAPSAAIIYPTQAKPTITPTINPTDTPAPTDTPPSPLPSWTLLPTLYKEDSREFVMELLKTNAGCELPCYWGIVPGQTSWEEAQHFFSSFTDRIGQAGTSITRENGIEYLRTGYSMYNKIAGYLDNISSSYGVINGVIDQMIVAPPGTELRYQLYQVLERYGAPEEVLIDAGPDSPLGKPYYWMVLFYPQRGILAFYEGEARLHAGKIQICSQGPGPELTLLPMGEMTLDEMQRSLLDLNVRAIMKPIDKATGMEVEDFSNEMKSPDSCFEVPPV